MPSAASHHPRAATCEEVDEETQAVLTGSRTTANVAQKRSQSDADTKPAGQQARRNGSDSGYSSKTGTNESIGSDHQKPPNLTLNTDVVDRAPQPYALTMSKSKSPNRPVANGKATKEKSRKREDKNGQSHDDCHLCQPQRLHLTPPERPATAVSAPEMPPPMNRRPSKAKADSHLRPNARRVSSIRQEQRPVSLIVSPSQPMYTPVFEGGPPGFNPYAIPTPITPSIVGNPYAQAHTPSPNHCAECIAQYEASIAYPATPQHFEPYPPPQYIPHHHEPPSIYHGQLMPHHELQVLQSYHQPPRPIITKVAKSPNADTMAMPPPPVPDMRRLSIDPNQSAVRRRSVHYADEEKHIVTAKRASRDMASYGQPVRREIPVVDTSIRPKGRKSMSYYDTAAADAAANVQRDRPPRRITDPLDERTAQVEAYQANVSRSAGALTAEALNHMERPRSSISDAGTSRSVRSSTRSSVKNKRSSTIISEAACTNIVFEDGTRLVIPQEGNAQDFNFQYGKFTISVNKDKDQPQLERTPSSASRNSRRSPPIKVTPEA